MIEISPFSALILAAGQGTRMKSALPKVLHEIAGRPLVAWPVIAAKKAGAKKTVVVLGYGKEQVEASLRARFQDDVVTALQPEPKGTGHAVQCGLSALANDSGYVVILYGDCPLLHAGVVTSLVNAAATSGKKVALLTGTLADPTGYGRMIRDDAGNVIAIREHKDCTPKEREIHEVNPGVYCIDLAFLRHAIAGLNTNNAQGELYLTDIVADAAREGGVASLSWEMDDLRGINDRYELSLVASTMRERIAKAHGANGVTIRDPKTAYIDGDVVIEEDATIEANVTLRGKTTIGKRAIIDVGAVLENVVVHEGARLKPYTVGTDSEIGTSAQIGPFSHLRPKTKLANDVHIGNFVETKATSLGARSKANHLAYLGDGVIGEDVNVGAGTIFCNYDGVLKHTTTLEDGVFIGSDSQLVAPVTVGRGAYVGTGTTVTKDVPADALAIGRARQENKEGYAIKLRALLKAKKDALKR